MRKQKNPNNRKSEGAKSNSIACMGDPCKQRTAVRAMPLCQPAPSWSGLPLWILVLMLSACPVMLCHCHSSRATGGGRIVSRHDLFFVPPSVVVYVARWRYGMVRAPAPRSSSNSASAQRRGLATAHSNTVLVEHSLPKKKVR